MLVRALLASDSADDRRRNMKLVIALLVASASALVPKSPLVTKTARATVTAPKMALVEEGAFVPDLERRTEPASTL